MRPTSKSFVRNLKSVLASQPWLKPVLKTIGNARCRAWDLVYGVDTCGEIPLVNLDFQSQNKASGHAYHSLHPSVIRAAFGALSIQHEDYTFVDFGCGKGRVLLIASSFPFRRIVGLEFAPALAETARRNLNSYRSSHVKCSEIEVITRDAVDYELEPEPQMLFFYNPFRRSLLDKILRNIEDSLQRRPRDLLVLVSGLSDDFGCRPQYERLQRGRYIDIYRHRSL